MRGIRKYGLVTVALVTAASLLLAACSGSTGAGELTVYSGRNQELVGPLLDQFSAQTGIELNVRYGGSSELAALLLQEGDKTPADVFLSQDAGAVGSVALEGALQALPSSATDRVEQRFVGPNSEWMGVTGRARVIIYNTDDVAEADLPTSVFDLTKPEWKDKVGIAPSNASFQAFVSAMRLEVGDNKTKSWLEAMKANGSKTYAKNTPIVEATARGEIEAGLVNSYYLPRIEDERGPLPAKNLFLKDGDPGALINVSAVGILKGAEDGDAAQRFVEFLLSDTSQTYFTEKTFEYALVTGIAPPAGNPPLAEVEGTSTDLTSLGKELPSTVAMLEEVGLL